MHLVGMFDRSTHGVCVWEDRALQAGTNVRFQHACVGNVERP